MSHKRTFEYTAKEKDKGLKTKPDWIWVKDSFLKPMVQEKTLNVTAIGNSWEVRVQRGRKLKEIAEMLRTKEDSMNILKKILSTLLNAAQRMREKLYLCF